MPELPEVETVKNTLKKNITNKKIININIFYANIIENTDTETFKKSIINQTIIDIKRRGKWLIFELNDYYLLSHLRMEGKYFIKNTNDLISKHEHISFILDDLSELRYQDTRKFGRMYLLEKKDLYLKKPLKDIGLEPWDKKLTTSYLKEKLKHKKLPIKTVLLDQSIIAGIGNIYADEILFLCQISPLKISNSLNDLDLENIINNTQLILQKAINYGGTTIRTYTASGVNGRFQQELLVHTKETCPNCLNKIVKIKCGGRGTYYCPNCQK